MNYTQVQATALTLLSNQRLYFTSYEKPEEVRKNSDSNEQATITYLGQYDGEDKNDIELFDGDMIYMITEWED